MPEIFYPLTSFNPKIVEELNKRREDRPSTDKTYSPKMGWARITSLAQVTFPGQDSPRVGFILNSNVGFDNIYGFGQQEDSGILGYWSNGTTPHRLSDINLVDLKRPSPGVTNISSELYSGEGKFVTATFTYKCYDQFQFQYLTPFFMTPGVTVCMEWGWAKNIPPSLLDVDNVESLVEIRDNWRLEQDKRINSSGNYELVLGMVTGYDFKLQADGSYDCSVEVRSLGYCVYGQSNDNETISTQDSVEVRKKTSKRISQIIETYLNSAVNLPEGQTAGFSANLLRKRIPKAKTGFSEKDGWITFDYFIKLLNAQKIFKFDKGDNSKAFSVNIENSWLSSSPNIKSTNGNVLLIPNPFAPAWPIEGDNIEFVFKGTNFTRTFEENRRFKDANFAIRKMAQSFRSNPGGYTGNTTYRLDLATLISGEGSEITFPNRDDPYTGHIKNLYIHKDVIIESLEAAHLTIQGLYDILKKISFASGNLWDFDIIVDPNNKTQVCIVDRNFPGFNSEGALLNIDNIKNTPTEYYTFSSLHSNSILRSLDFSVKLSDEVGTQVMMNGSDSNVSRDDDKFYQVLYSESNPSGSVKIVDVLSRLKSKKETSEETEPLKDINSENFISQENRNEPIINSESSKIVEPVDDNSEYFPINIQLKDEFGDSRDVVFRLVEPNDEIIKTSVGNDDSPFNSTRFNGLVQGINITLTLTGISGLNFQEVFDIDNLPYPYNKAIFQITNIKHSWSSNDWVTNVEAMIRPRPSLFLGEDQGEQ